MWSATNWTRGNGRLAASSHLFSNRLITYCYSIQPFIDPFDSHIPGQQFMLQSRNIGNDYCYQVARTNRKRWCLRLNSREKEKTVASARNILATVRVTRYYFSYTHATSMCCSYRFYGSTKQWCVNSYYVVLRRLFKSMIQENASHLIQRGEITCAVFMFFIPFDRSVQIFFRFDIDRRVDTRDHVSRKPLAHLM